MVNFIEVTEKDSKKKIFVNVNHIEMVVDNTIYFAFAEPTAEERDYIKCIESYEEICSMIKCSTY